MAKKATVGSAKSKKAHKALHEGKKLEPTKPLTVNVNRYDPYKSYRSL